MGVREYSAEYSKTLVKYLNKITSVSSPEEMT